MSIYIPVLLGVLQGLTEFLPVSSSGHLVIAQHLFGLHGENLALDTILHAATALAIVAVFRKDIMALAAGCFSREYSQRSRSWHYTGFIAIGTIPAGLAGVFLKDFFEEMFSRPHMVGIMLCVTGSLLLLQRVRHKGSARVTVWSALIVGCAQACAIMPGISRSGATIAAALLCGIAREEAGRFSFLLALPAICGAMVLQIPDMGNIDISMPFLLSGFAAGFIVGVIALKFLLAFVARGRIHHFAWYCFAAGIAAAVFL